MRRVFAWWVQSLQTMTNSPANENVSTHRSSRQGAGLPPASLGLLSPRGETASGPEWAWLTRPPFQAGLAGCWVAMTTVAGSRRLGWRLRAMGSKKKEIALQVNISTQELWEEMLSTKGLTVVDVHQGWCGPCKPMVSLFQKMRIEVGLDLLHFALAEADCLDVLEKYRGRCEPTFLFYAGGELVAVVRGANAPLLQKIILDQLEAEKKVLAEGRERKVIKDEALSDEDENVSRGKDIVEDEDVVSSEKPCTVAIVKPDAVAHGKTDEIIMKIQEAGFDILTSEERTMTEAEMRLFYQHRAGEEAFEKLVHHMCSGPSHLLILTRTEGAEDVVTAWQTLMGPCDPSVARREQPESLRAQYGTEMPFNAVHGSQDGEAAHRELALLFPNLKFLDKEAPQGRRILEESLKDDEDLSSCL
ncbi:thioredoxin domain-containing protein 6 isoform X2 [Nycticebus coucang]|uniref:thioredoxin domain-containing protein 6 isoform X2 n=1 Tax=Nycticebus coucang TaxID=9470 RepID=UPI00234CE5AF|nr:thioredoxin domain-containing protein 6 isoform X2 [Nycticebus coucang]